eukprot:jgi/Botrbrau1/19850/Bobra.0124s0086.1
MPQDLARYLAELAKLVGVHGFISVDMPYLHAGSDFPFAHLHFLADAWQALICRPLLDGSSLLRAAARNGMLLRPRTAFRFSRGRGVSGHCTQEIRCKVQLTSTDGHATVRDWLTRPAEVAMLQPDSPRGHWWAGNGFVSRKFQVGDDSDVLFGIFKSHCNFQAASPGSSWIFVQTLMHFEVAKLDHEALLSIIEEQSSWCFIMEEDGKPVAAILARPLKVLFDHSAVGSCENGEGPRRENNRACPDSLIKDHISSAVILVSESLGEQADRDALEVSLVATDPHKETYIENMSCLLSFFFHLVLMDDAIQRVHGGNVHLEDLANDILVETTYWATPQKEAERRLLLSQGQDTESLAVWIAGHMVAPTTQDHQHVINIRDTSQYTAAYAAIVSEVEEYIKESRDDPEEIFSADVPFMDAGLDSLDLLKLANRINGRLSIAVPPTTMFDYPTAADLAEHIAHQQQAAEVPVENSSSRRRLSSFSLMFENRRRSLADVFHRRSSLFNDNQAAVRSDVQEGTSLGRIWAYRGSQGSIFEGRNKAARDAQHEEEDNQLASTGGKGAAYAALFPLREWEPSFKQGFQDHKGCKALVVEAGTWRLPMEAQSHMLHVNFQKDMPKLVPYSRWDIDDQSITGLLKDRMLSRFSACLPDVVQFDSENFNLSRVEACLMDPQQRILLEVCHETLANAQPHTAVDATKSHVPLSRQQKETAKSYFDTGIYIGISYNEYAQAVGCANPGVSTYTATGGSLSVAPGRIAYVFGLSGPAVAVDTACSSGLVAVTLAHDAVQIGTCYRALAAGINTLLSPFTHAAYAVAGMLALDGRCKTLDTSADGYVRAEAVGMVLLRMLSADTSQAGHGGQALALLVAAVVNQDGRSSSLTAPNGPAQSALIRACLDMATLTPSSVTNLQLHGTGTSLGDPIEVNGALAAIRPKEVKDAQGPLVLAAHKVSCGHAEPAAGLLGVAAALSIQAAAASPLLHLKSVNRHLHCCLGGPSRMQSAWLPREGSSLPSSTPGNTFTGVSSFAFQGTNSHVILETMPHDSTPPKVQQQSRLYRRSRCWYTISMHPLLLTCIRQSGRGNPQGICSFTCPLKRPILAFLADDQISLCGHLPASVNLEASTAAASALTSQSDTPKGLVLHDVVLPQQTVQAEAGLLTSNLVIQLRLQDACITVRLAGTGNDTGFMSGRLGMAFAPTSSSRAAPARPALKTAISGAQHLFNEE